MAKKAKRKTEQAVDSTQTLTPSLLTQLQNTARNARTHTARHLAKAGLYPGQDLIIQLLAERDAMAPTELAAALGVRAPTITKSINRLVEQGFVARSKTEGDGRRVQIQLTEPGNNLLKKAHKLARKSEAQALKKMTAEETAQLSMLLAKLNTHLEKRNTKASAKPNNSTE